MNLTVSQQQAVDHRGTNLLVCASAGSGKTEVLTRRVVSLICDPHRPCDIDRLLVVTFTRAAAAELRVRTRRLLQERIERTPDQALRERLRRQQLLVESADIGTIDAWCGRIVRAHAEVLGVDPNFSMLSEEEALLLRSQVLDDFMRWLCADADPRACAARDFLARQPRPDDRLLRDLIRQLSSAREHLIDPQLWLQQQQSRLAGEAQQILRSACRTLSRALHRDCTSLREHLEELPRRFESPGLNAALRPWLNAAADWCQRLTAAPESGDNLLGVIEALANPPCQTARNLSEPEARIYERGCKRWIERLRKRWDLEATRRILETAPTAAEWLRLLIELEQLYHQRLTEAKRLRAVCEFADVLRFALELLSRRDADGALQPSPVAIRYAAHYEHILVDEYQDTSPVQVEILRLVSRSEPGRGNRFLVGDLKQSIYSFRQAEPRLFARLINDFESGRQEGRVHYLSDNFRSHPQLLDALNRIFAVLFDPDLGGTAFGEAERLRAARPEIANPTLDARHRIELHLFEVPKDRRRAGTAPPMELEPLEREALFAARTIRELLNAGIQIPQQGPAGALLLRPLRLADVVILLRSAHYNAATVARVLRQHDLPCTTAGREAWAEAPEIRDIRNVLTLLVNRRQDVPLAAWLRSPMAGLSAAELLRIRTFCPRGDFYRAVVRFASQEKPSKEDHELVSKVRAALLQLDHWQETALQEELPDLLRRIYHETGYPLFVQALPLGEHRVNLLRSLQSLAADFTRAGHHGLAEFDAWLEELAATELDPGVAVPAAEDAIRIMTIHAAKGLEFPVVFLLNAGARFNRTRQRQPLQFDPEVGLGLQVWDWRFRNRVESFGWSLARDAAAMRELEEELRLLYVAATRAREKLFIFGHDHASFWADMHDYYADMPPWLLDRQTVNSPLEWLMMAAATDPAAAAVTVHPCEPVAAEPLPASQTQPGIPADEPWLEQSRQLLAFRPDRSLSKLPAVISVTTAVELAAPPPDPERTHLFSAEPVRLGAPAFAVHDRQAARARGLAYHRFMEHADPACFVDQKLLQDQLATLVAAGRLSAAEAELLDPEDLLWFGSTPLAATMRHQAHRLHREVGFVYAWPLAGAATQPCGSRGSAEYTLIRGIIDCLVETPAGLVILDFKTDEAADPELFREKAAGYSLQLQLYAQAAAAIFGQKVCQASLVFLRQRRILEVDPGCPPAVEQLLSALY
jgi:ATP-dependent helicase/nuclease subunit A